MGFLLVELLGLVRLEAVIGGQTGAPAPNSGADGPPPVKSFRLVSAPVTQLEGECFGPAAAASRAAMCVGHV